MRRVPYFKKDDCPNLREASGKPKKCVNGVCSKCKVWQSIKLIIDTHYIEQYDKTMKRVL